MRFSELYPQPIVIDFDVANVCDDSRLVQAGDIFIFDKQIIEGGEQFIEQALQKGAEAVVTNVEGLDNPKIFYDETPGLILAKWAKHKFPKQPKTLVAVTGTNGKTSIAWFYQTIASYASKGKAASLGTLGIHQNGEKVGDTGYTTPTALRLHEELHKLAEAGVEFACMEASSHAMSLNRMDGCDIKAAAFTNLTPDHRDFHGSMDAYFAAKARLFTEILPETGTAVLNIQKMETWPLSSMCNERQMDILTVGTGNAELVVAPTEYRADGMKVDIRYDQFHEEINLPLLGVFQAENLATAIGLCLASGLKWEDIIEGVKLITSVPGRMEVIETNNETAPTVLVDYAHTPDALERALMAVKPNVVGKLWCVFGCGGDRDKGKRPLMGSVVNKLADKPIVTDDNPRSEDAAIIREEVMAMCPNGENIGDRRQAIAHAIENASADDVVLLAGKGHESGQIIGTETVPFDDREVSRTILNGEHI